MVPWYDIIYMWNLKKKKEKKRTHRYREQIGGFQGHGVKGGQNG